LTSQSFLRLQPNQAANILFLNLLLRRRKKNSSQNP
jgi:hypothetical protein